MGDFQNVSLFICYSIPLRDFLISKKLRYKVVGINPNTNKMFWVFVRDIGLEKQLDAWSQNKSA